MDSPGFEASSAHLYSRSSHPHPTPHSVSVYLPSPAHPAWAEHLLPARVREGMVPKESARLRRPGSEEGEARRGDRNSCWLASGRKPGGLGMNRDAAGPAPGHGTARLGLVGKRPAESLGKHLQEPVGHGRQEEGQPREALEVASTQIPSPLPWCQVGPESGSQGGVR